MEPATADRIQQMIDAEATERFAPDAVPRLRLLRYGDHPAIEPGELYLLVIVGEDGATQDAWMDEHFDHLVDLRARRLPEVKGFMFTTGARERAGRAPGRILQMDGISLLDPEEDEIARGLVPVTALLGPADLATLDALITAGIAASRAEAARWALARIREQPADAQPGERARETGEPRARAGMDRAVRDRRQTRVDGQVKAYFPDGGVRRVALVEYGDDPSVEPGDLLVRVFVDEVGEGPNLRAWHRDHERMFGDLERELAEQLPGASHLEFWFGENGRGGKSSHRLGVPPDEPARSTQDLTLADVRFGPADLEMLDALVTTGTATSRAGAVGWILARIRERPAYARLTERARELDELKARF